MDRAEITGWWKGFYAGWSILGWLIIFAHYFGIGVH